MPKCKSFFSAQKMFGQNDNLDSLCVFLAYLYLLRSAKEFFFHFAIHF